MGVNQSETEAEQSKKQNLPEFIKDAIGMQAKYETFFALLQFDVSCILQERV